MKTHPIILAIAALLISGGIASAQKVQYDSLGSPTPANQNASPNANEPNVPRPGTTGQGGLPDRAAPPKSANTPAAAGQDPKLSAGNAGTEKTNGVTPGGLTPD